MAVSNHFNDEKSGRVHWGGLHSWQTSMLSIKCVSEVGGEERGQYAWMEFMMLKILEKKGEMPLLTQSSSADSSLTLGKRNAFMCFFSLLTFRLIQT